MAPNGHMHIIFKYRLPYKNDVHENKEVSTCWDRLQDTEVVTPAPVWPRLQAAYGPNMEVYLCDTLMTQAPSMVQQKSCWTYNVETSR